ncbi:MAG: hypothetical protein Q7T16_02355 [Candidatus Burarchaeum sp.]|nr:hypothetical protein [Candidatus Burarchaeum sp.]MDO8339476.1 hypothetical protein [Candidatus Burarchaeum sp.]
MRMTKKPNRRRMPATLQAKAGVKIEFASAGKDFHLEIRGGGLAPCEETFERLFEKVSTKLERKGEAKMPQYG